MGSADEWNTVPAAHIARAVYKVELPVEKESVEYYIQAVFDDDEILMWPPSAPSINHTVVAVEVL